MSNINNDIKILKLKEQIAKKKEELKDIERFSPVTNCSIELEGVRYNLNVLPKDQLQFLAIKLQSFKSAAEVLKVKLDISGFYVGDWIDDILSKLKILNIKEEKANLKQMESKLDRLLSNEKKVELEINEIEELLK